ncbi:MAG: GSCFA domain-containing protein [Shimia sp.]|nr:GSCFA domain-containing protein [Shimia sp.]
MARFKTETFMPANVTPKFQISKDASVFTIGSCFARNVEDALVTAGVDVITTQFDFESDLLLNSVGALANKPNPRSLLNKYSTQAIHSELHRVLKATTPPDRGFLEIEDGKWVDPQLAAILKPLKKETLSELRDSVEALVRRVCDADAVIITLGLSETWFDNVSNLYLNSSPPPRLMKSAGDRFEFINSSYAQSYAAIKDAISLIREHSNKDVKFILTVSPVPMSTTWTSNDVIAANTYSKSLLRVVAQTLAEENDFIDYYPSYEIVTNSPRGLAWQNDELHVAPDMVNFAISTFLGKYIEDQ